MSKAEGRKSAEIRLAISLVLITCLLAIYILRNPAWYVVHVWPMWAWSPLVLLPWISLRFWKLWKGIAISCGVWLVLLLILGEPPLRSVLPPSRERPKETQLRVVTLNCSGGMVSAAREVFALEPDLIIFSEAPGQTDLEELAEKKWGEGSYVLAGPDAAILVRNGEGESPREEMDHTAATITLDSGESLQVVGLRLMPPVLRFDLVNPSAWAAYRRDLEQKLQQLKAIPQGDIVAGDFNTPSVKNIGKVLTGMTEAGAASRGWPYTAINTVPLVRIDQIWSSDRLKLVQSFVVKSEYSDHRLSVADYSLSSSSE